jgi:predicted metalloprotease with PDZ domain
MKYIVSYSPHHQHFIDIEIVIKVSNPQTQVQCPAWRPGRYEIGNFSGNVRSWRAMNEKGEALQFRKLTKDLWEVQTANCKELHVFYNYYAADLNAGSTYLDDRQLYMNPVNCCMYVPELRNEPISMELLLPAGYKIACSMQQVKPKKVETHYMHTLTAPNYDELADSPLIASPALQMETILVDKLKVNIWFQGEIKPNWTKIKNDFFIFIREQVLMMGGCPVDEYHFIYQALPYKFHHGVEHLGSTVIAVGPSYNLMKDEQFNSFLGVSCHEFFHCWNIKTIRPIEMFPYDYTKENYSRLGYVYEGVTDYYADYLLLRSGVFTEFDYLKAVQQQIQKHFDNYGRYNLGVADSSFDTWLDGYIAGAPYRKVSIYTEGALLAFIVDTFIRSNTGNAKSLDDVMRTLYYDYAMEGKPYREADYWNIIEHTAGKSCRYIFDNYVNKAADLDTPLDESLLYIGLMMQTSPSKRHYERYYGMKVMEEDGRHKVAAVVPGSPAELAGICVNDEIHSINGHALRGNFNDWCAYYGKDQVKLSLISQSFRRYVDIKPFEEKEYFPSYFVVKKKDATPEQKEAYRAWCHHIF